MGFRFLPYQTRWIYDDRPMKIALKARQIGYTTAICAEACRLAGESTCNLMILSATERQSIEVLNRVYGFLRVWERAYGGKLPRETKTEVEFPNGSRIISLPASERSVRGYTGHVFLDEFAFHQDASAIWRAMLPCTTRGYRVRVVSTPAGKAGKFWDLWRDAQEGCAWSAHRVDLLEAMGSGLRIDAQALRAGCSADDWAQEYMCEFLDENYSLFPYELITAAVAQEDMSVPAWEGRHPAEEWWLGVDIGRHHDITAVVALDRAGDVFRVRALRELRGAPFDVQRAEIEAAMAALHPRRVCIDASGLGMQLAEELTRKHGARVEGVTFTSGVKEDLATRARMLFDQRRVRIPDDQKLISDIHGIRRIVTPAGNVRFDAERNQDGHSDRFWALALALHAAGTAAGPMIFVSGGRRDTVRMGEMM